MIKSTKWFPVILWCAVFSGAACAEENAEVEALKKEVAALSEELEELRTAMESMQIQLDLLTEDDNVPHAADKVTSKKNLLSDRLTVGVVLEGDYRAGNSPAIGKIRFTVESRDKNAFTGTCELEYDGKDLGKGTCKGSVRGRMLQLVRVGSGKRFTINLLYDHDVLEGTFVDEQQNKGRVGLRFQ